MQGYVLVEDCRVMVGVAGRWLEVAGRWLEVAG
jgi:hypothetical protein